MKISSRRVVYMTCCGLAAASAMTSAMAADPATGTKSSSGLMQFPNVTITSAKTPAKTVDAAATSAASARAYKDQETGRLRSPTPAELLAEAFLEPAPSQPEAQAILPSATGGLVAYLGDSGLVYMVANRDESGAVSADCVTDAKSDTDALASAQADKGVSHDR